MAAAKAKTQRVKFAMSAHDTNNEHSAKPTFDPFPTDPPRSRTTNSPVSGFRAVDAVPSGWMPPLELAQGKSSARSLMQPQPLAKRLLPAELYIKLVEFAIRGCPTDCGPPWSKEVLAAARAAGPHVSALTPENVQLIWDDVSYQAAARFVRLVPDHILFGPKFSPETKISRLAVVPQHDRRGRLILNLSARVTLPPERIPNSRRKRKRTHPSVNETTADVPDQEPVKALGTAMAAILHFCFETPWYWEILWQKIDLSDGFWRMIVEAGKEYNFVYEMPPRPGDGGKRYFVVPSSLQMGWKNSPVYFCTATEAGRELLRRLLALSIHSGPIEPHPYEKHCLSQMAKDLPEWCSPTDLAILSRVFVDDYINGIAGPPGRATQVLEELWLARCALTSIHAVFPTPEVLNHQDGRDSISLKKLGRGDARFDPTKVLLGFLVKGSVGQGRLIGLPVDKANRYVADLDEALGREKNWISFNAFQKLHGKLVHISLVLPCIMGFLSVLNKVLQKAPHTVGLKKGSDLRCTLEAFRFFTGMARDRPSHITELVGPDLPHIYGYIDAARGGMGGVLLPCTKWVSPAVWRFEFPSPIKESFDRGEITINDLEAIAHFVGERLIDQLLDGRVEGISSWFGSDNSTTESWKQKKSDRGKAKSRVAPTLLRAEALLQRFTRRGPQDINHVDGHRNLMADFASRSYDPEWKGKYPAGERGDQAFFNDFAHNHPLPPQLGYWTLVHPAKGIISAACSMLLGIPVSDILPRTGTGDAGLTLPCILANTLSCPTSRPIPNIWNEASCSWPLLSHFGKVDTTMASKLQARKSRLRYETARSAWYPEDLRTLADQLRGPPVSTSLSQPTTGDARKRIQPPDHSKPSRAPPLNGSQQGSTGGHFTT